MFLVTFMLVLSKGYILHGDVTVRVKQNISRDKRVRYHEIMKDKLKHMNA